MPTSTYQDLSLASSAISHPFLVQTHGKTKLSHYTLNTTDTWQNFGWFYIPSYKVTYGTTKSNFTRTCLHGQISNLKLLTYPKSNIDKKASRTPFWILHPIWIKTSWLLRMFIVQIVLWRTAKNWFYAQTWATSWTLIPVRSMRMTSCFSQKWMASEKREEE